MTSHCLLLEFCGGAVSRNFHAVVKQAEARAAKAGVARAAAAEAAAALQGDEAASLVAARASAAEKAAADALDQQKACASAWAFLTRGESLRRLLFFRGILEPFRKLKSTIMRRNGAAWETEQQVSALEGRTRQYRAGQAASRQEIIIALKAITTFMGLEPAYVKGTQDSDGGSDF